MASRCFRQNFRPRHQAAQRLRVDLSATLDFFRSSHSVSQTPIFRIGVAVYEREGVFIEATDFFEERAA